MTKPRKIIPHSSEYLTNAALRHLFKRQPEIVQLATILVVNELHKTHRIEFTFAGSRTELRRISMLARYAIDSAKWHWSHCKDLETGSVLAAIRAALWLIAINTDKYVGLVEEIRKIKLPA